MNRILTLTLVAALLCVTSQANASVTLVDQAFLQSLPTNNNFDGELGALGFDSIWTASFTFNRAQTVRFFYHGAESGFTDSFRYDSNSFAESGNAFDDWDPNGFEFGSITVSAGETIGLTYNNRLGFTTSSGSGVDAAMGEAGFGVFGDTNSVISSINDPLRTRYYFGYDDDGAGPDDNHDDMIVSMLVIPEPMSLAIWAGLAGVCVIRRRRQSRS